MKLTLPPPAKLPCTEGEFRLRKVTVLPGTEIGAALTAIEAIRPDIVGMNCATGPVEMGEHLRHLSNYAHVPISCLPNAGLPSVVLASFRYSAMNSVSRDDARCSMSPAFVSLS